MGSILDKRMTLWGEHAWTGQSTIEEAVTPTQRQAGADTDGLTDEKHSRALRLCCLAVVVSITDAIEERVVSCHQKGRLFCASNSHL